MDRSHLNNSPMKPRGVHPAAPALAGVLLALVGAGLSLGAVMMTGGGRVLLLVAGVLLILLAAGAVGFSVALQKARPGPGEAPLG